MEKQIGCPAKKSWKRRDGGEANVEMKDIALVDEVPTSLEGIVEEIPGVPAIEAEISVPTRKTKVAPLVPMDIEMVEMTFAITSPTLPIIVEEEVQVAKPRCLHCRWSWPLLR